MGLAGKNFEGGGRRREWDAGVGGGGAAVTFIGTTDLG